MVENRRCRVCLLITVVCFDLLATTYYFRYPSIGGNLLPSTFQSPFTRLIPKAFQNSLPLKNPYLHQECYNYDNLTATFSCNEFYPYVKYTRERIFECASKLWNATRDHKELDPWRTNSSKSSPEDENIEAAVRRRPGVHLVLVGDSHIRNIFEVLVKRISSPRVRYRISSFNESQWENVPVMMSQKRENIHEPYHEVIHLDLPLKITYRWEAMLENLPSSIQSWISGKAPRPSALLFGTALHFMKDSKDFYVEQGPEKAAEKYSDHLKFLAPLAAELGKTTPTVFKLLDHLQRHPTNIISNNENIDKYNDIARNVLAVDRVALWDSTLPLSDLYNEECRIRFKETPETDTWKCQDRRHIGYIMIEQYVDMYLNDICNAVLQ